MSIAQSLLGEFDHEMANTRKMLERCPSNNPDWRPHEKSFTMSRLAGHVAELPQFITNTIKMDVLDMKPGEYKPFFATSAAAALEHFDAKVKEARAALAGASDEHLMKPWAFKFDGKPVFEMPRVAVLRSFCMNHLIHHRAQLGVYYRLNNIPVPALYGPSADEQAF